MFSPWVTLLLIGCAQLEADTDTDIHKYNLVDGVKQLVSLCLTLISYALSDTLWPIDFILAYSDMVIKKCQEIVKEVFAAFLLIERKEKG